MRFPLGKKVFLLGTPGHANVGDSAIVLGERQFLIQQGIREERIKEITVSEYQNNAESIGRLIRPSEPVFWHGGGNMGDQWLSEELFRREVLTKHPKNPVFVFPQTIYYTPTEQGETERIKSKQYYDGREKLTITAREKESYEIMQDLYPNTNVMLSPDIVLSTQMDAFGVEHTDRKDIVFCFRNDPERAMTDQLQHELAAIAEEMNQTIRYTDMMSSYAPGKEKRKIVCAEKMREFVSARVVLTDRLHGMVFAALTGTPCIVFSNYNHKVFGTYDWIRYLPYIRTAQTAEDVRKLLPELLAMENCVFDNGPLMPYFEPLAKVVREYADH